MDLKQLIADMEGGDAQERAGASREMSIHTPSSRGGFLLFNGSGLLALIVEVNMKGLHAVAFILLVIGGLNWGLVGLGWWMGGADWNVVHMILGSLGSSIEGLVYVLVGLSAVFLVVDHKKTCKYCMGKMGGGAM